MGLSIENRGLFPLVPCHNLIRDVDYGVIGVRLGGTNATRIFPKMQEGLRFTTSKFAYQATPYGARPAK